MEKEIDLSHLTPDELFTFMCNIHTRCERPTHDEINEWFTRTLPLIQTINVHLLANVFHDIACAGINVSNEWQNAWLNRLHDDFFWLTLENICSCLYALALYTPEEITPFMPFLKRCRFYFSLKPKKLRFPENNKHFFSYLAKASAYFKQVHDFDLFFVAYENANASMECFGYYLDKNKKRSKHKEIVWQFLKRIYNFPDAYGDNGQDLRTLALFESYGNKTYWYREPLICDRYYWGSFLCNLYDFLIIDCKKEFKAEKSDKEIRIICLDQHDFIHKKLSPERKLEALLMHKNNEKFIFLNNKYIDQYGFRYIHSCLKQFMNEDEIIERFFDFGERIPYLILETIEEIEHEDITDCPLSLHEIEHLVHNYKHYINTKDENEFSCANTNIMKVTM